jgi:hypothetical protein
MGTHASFREGYMAYYACTKLGACWYPVLSPRWERWRTGWLGAMSIDREARLIEREKRERGQA